MDKRLKHNTLKSLNAIFDAAPDPVLLVDRGGLIRAMSQQTMVVFGHGEGDLLGFSVEKLLPESLQASHVSLRDQYFSSPRTRPMGVAKDLFGRHKNGDLIPIEVSLSPVDLDGDMHAVCIIRDVSESKAIRMQLEQQAAALARSNEELQQFAYIASHDLQEPLRMIAGYIQLLQRRYQGKLSTEADEFIDYAVQGVKRMQRLITDLLSYSRLTSRDVSVQPVDLNELLEQVTANLHVAIEESGAVIVADKLPVVSADEVQMIQVFQNLIGNAIKFSGDKAPQVRLSVSELSHDWQFCISDKGIGIDEQYKDQIFEIFQRLHTPEQYPGTGIGLAICKKILNRHGGQIWLDGNYRNGAKFCFTLPKSS